jgi:hypothetical protein
MSRKALVVVAAATASFAPHRIRLRSSRVQRQMLCGGWRGEVDFLLAKNPVGMERKVRMVMMQWQSQSLQSGGNFLWEVSSLGIVFSRLSKTTFVKTARSSITISFAGTATAKL